MKRSLIKDLLKLDCAVNGADVNGADNLVVKGWVRSLRKGKSFSFIMLNDGSSQQSLQIVADSQLANYDDVSKMTMGYCVSVQGRLVSSSGKGQSVELQAQSIEILGEVAPEYPLQKKATSLEFLREVAHLRARTNTFGAVFRMRHALSLATHKFFSDRGFYYVHTPIITASDCEGAGAMFKVTTLDIDSPATLPLSKNQQGQQGHQGRQEKLDYTKDYFSRAAHLTVSGQLEAECFALGLGAVYTFGPTFRAENSNTPRHLSEFWMIEPEVSFCDLDQLADLATDYLQFLIGYVLDNYFPELTFLQELQGQQEQQEQQNEGLVARLQQVREAKFTKITYTEAITILERSTASKQFEFKVSWGMDLQTEHERYLTEQHFRGPVIVTDYPQEIKAFYMKQNSDGKTVRAMDVLVPGIGEIMGGSQREDDYQKLFKRINDLGLNPDDYWWYLDLRKFGSAPHSGFGLGLERALMYITGMNNIRDVIPFPRYPGSAEF
ncbi:MAG: asparagine--tRNA ligase [Oligoflexia bacterium]|nr:asparagine--tRNA ligase [Oligoflexia bacterium]